MILDRRSLLLGVAALGLAGAPGAASALTGARRLALFREGSEIGEKTVSVRRDGTQVDVETRIDIAATVLGVTVYRYRLQARETWRNGALAKLEAETNDNGTAHFARAERDATGALVVEGSVYSGPVAGNPATTSYWSPAFLERPVWISTQDGRLLDVTARNLGPVAFEVGGGAVEATRWRIGGDLRDLFLYYDAAGEWLGTEFPARGATARFVAEARAPRLTPLWVGA